jgi:hypothetical protein
LFNVDFNFALLASNMASVGASTAKECFACDSMGIWEGALCPACVQAGTSPEGLDGASTETIQEKNSRVLQELSEEVDQLKGAEGSSQHALVELAHIKKQKIIHSGPQLHFLVLHRVIQQA